MRRVLRLTGTVLVAAILAVVVAEIALRVVDYGEDLFPAGPRWLFVADERLGVRLRPSFRGRHRAKEFDVRIETNALGLREREIGSPSPPAIRIVCTGDSFCYGHGVEAEEAYPRRLEESLRSRGLAVEVVNAGVPSYGTLEQALWLESDGERLAPAVVVASFFSGNDLKDNVRAPGERLTERFGYPVSREVARVVDASPGWRLSGRWRLVLYVRWNLLRRLERQQEAAARAATPAALPPPGEPHLYTGVPLMLSDSPPWLDPFWVKFEEDLARIGEACDRLGARLVLLYVPTAAETSERERAAALAAFDMTGLEIDSSRSRNRVAGIAERLGIDFVDPTPALSTEDPPQPNYYPEDRHWTPAGHARAAEVLAERVRALPR